MRHTIDPKPLSTPGTMTPTSTPETENPPSLHEARSTYRTSRREARAEYKEARSEWRAARHEARQVRRESRRGGRHCGSSSSNSASCGSSSTCDPPQSYSGCHGHRSRHGRRSHEHVAEPSTNNEGRNGNNDEDIERYNAHWPLSSRRGLAPWASPTLAQPRPFCVGKFLAGTVAKALGFGKGAATGNQHQPRGFVTETALPPPPGYEEGSGYTGGGGYGDRKDRGREQYIDEYGEEDIPGVEEGVATDVSPTSRASGGAVEIDGTERSTLFGQRVVATTTADEEQERVHGEPLPRYEAVVRGSV